MNVFIDTNIFIDIFLGRQIELQSSLKIFDLAHKGDIQIYFSAISVNNIYYICSKQSNREKTLRFLEYITNTYNIVHTNSSIIQNAISQPNKDFEDMIQFFSAKLSDCDYIISRNPKDFPNIIPKTIGPKQFLSKY